MHAATSPIDQAAPQATPQRQERPLDERRLRLTLMAGGAIGLVAGIVWMVIALPTNDVALGFDILLVALMATTAVLVFLRRQLVPVAAFTTGLLLICDASFDVETAGPHDLWLSALTATLVELPVAVILMATALRILRANRAADAAARFQDAAIAVGSAAVEHAYA
jgi:hypothetical protein